MANFIQITPFMQVADVAAAVRFFVEVLGFEAQIEGPTYAYVQRETAGVRIMKALSRRSIGTRMSRRAASRGIGSLHAPP